MNWVQLSLYELWYYELRALEVQRMQKLWVRKQWQLELELMMQGSEAPLYALLELAAPL